MASQLPSLNSGSRLLRFYSYYSLFLALLIIVTDGLDKADRLLGERAPQLFLVLSSIYVISAASFVALANRRPDSQAAASYMFLETALLAGMMYASGGLEAGFSSLLLIPVIIANLLAPGVLGISVAAWLSLSVFYTEHFATQDFALTDIANTGVYGAISFAIAVITQLLARRIRSALDLAQDQAHNARRLQQLSQQALMTLPDGIIACSKNRNVLFFNQQAELWFELQSGEPLPALLAEVGRRQKLNSGNLRLTVSRINIAASSGEFLLLLEDDARIAAEAQQIKLASLGRLTASIAHEIRNPLSALNQAAQLLSEAPYLHREDRELTRIIEENSQRINRTIVDILQLSRGRQAVSHSLNLYRHLISFRDHFEQLQSGDDYDLVVDCSDDLTTEFDPDHLTQVLTNLCMNGLRYARKARPQRARIEIRAYRCAAGIILDVTDNGLGVAENQLDRLFEPFSTTEHDGTGLGLYLCRELCQANQAQIDYAGHDAGATFRIRMMPSQ